MKGACVKCEHCLKLELFYLCKHPDKIIHVDNLVTGEEETSLVQCYHLNYESEPCDTFEEGSPEIKRGLIYQGLRWLWNQTKSFCFDPRSDIH